VVGALFLCTLFFAPLVQAIPAAATAPALILVGHDDGRARRGGLDRARGGHPRLPDRHHDPLTYSIANGLAFGIISHAILKLLRGRATLRDWLVYVLSALFIARFIYLA